MASAFRKCLRPVVGLAAKNGSPYSQGIRCMSLLDVNMDDKTGICKLTMQNKPANALTMEMLTGLRDNLTELHNNPKCKAVILGSNTGVFCAGLDLKELIGAYSDETRFREYWTCVQDVNIRLFSMKPFTLAAINGSAPAAGCVLAIASDYRIMASGKHVIGLNETQIGIDVPPMVTEIYYNLVGSSEALRNLPLGKMHSVENALKIHLIDEVCERDQLDDRAMDTVKKVLKTTETEARYTTKMYMRQPSLDKILAGKQANTDHMVELFKREKIHKILQGYLMSLNKK